MTTFLVRAAAGFVGRVIGAAAAHGISVPGRLPSWDEFFSDPADRLWDEKTAPKKPVPEVEPVVGQVKLGDCVNDLVHQWLSFGAAASAGDYTGALELLRLIDQDLYDGVLRVGHQLEEILGRPLSDLLSSNADGETGPVCGPAAGESPAPVPSSSAGAGQPTVADLQQALFAAQQVGARDDADAVSVVRDYAAARTTEFGREYWAAIADKIGPRS